MQEKKNPTRFAILEIYANQSDQDQTIFREKRLN
jgi:hypothetical protein